MNEQLKSRLSELKAEYAAGQKALAELRSKQEDMEATLARINGAIEELQAELKKAGADGSGATTPGQEGIKRRMSK